VRVSAWVCTCELFHFDRIFAHNFVEYSASTYWWEAFMNL
jgi:hypothetical protein